MLPDGGRDLCTEQVGMLPNMAGFGEIGIGNDRFEASNPAWSTAIDHP